MDLQGFLNQAKDKASSTVRSVSDLMGAAADAVGTGIGYAKESLTSSWLFGSTEESAAISAYDEKHYFLVPNKLTTCGYSLYSMRCLPEGVPPVNELPKRRVIHLPNEHGRRMIEELLCEEARSAVAATGDEASPMGRRLNDIADGIDKLDKAAFRGALLIGGLVALANPVAGGMLAAKAMLPSIGLFLSRYGLQQASESLTERGVQKQIEAAESDVLNQFQGSETSEFVDPLLAQLDKALNTDVFEYDPIVDGAIDVEDCMDASATPSLNPRITITAICNTYDEILDDSKRHQAAHLGPEDIRWLTMLRTLAEIK